MTREDFKARTKAYALRVVKSLIHSRVTEPRRHSVINCYDPAPRLPPIIGLLFAPNLRLISSPRWVSSKKNVTNLCSGWSC